MNLIVRKYGGTSVGTIQRIKDIAKHLVDARRAGDRLVVVLSAMTGETNRLVDLAHKINPEPSGRELDAMISTGEQVSISLLALALENHSCPVISLTGRQVPIITDSQFGKARIKSIDCDTINEFLSNGKIVIVAGFQGIDVAGNVTTLGRGGSDTTAVALAASLKAKECQIYTDVDGVYTTDPRIVNCARRMDFITFEEMLEMSSLGAKVLQIRSVEFAGIYKVPLRVLSSLQKGPGTLISLEDSQKMEQPVISGIAFSRNEGKITLPRVPDVPGIAARILSPIGERGIEVDMIVQNIGADGLTDFTFTVDRSYLEVASSLLKPIQLELGADDLIADADLCKVSVVGVGMRSHAGVASTMFSALAKEGINIQMISTSEIKISVVIAEKYLELAVRTLHSIFDLDIDVKTIET